MRKYEHSMSCEWPEGCSCGAAKWNRLIDQRDHYKRLVESGAAPREFERGYFCALAAYLKENCAEGVNDTVAASLFGGCKNWQAADKEDIETLKRHGLITPPNHPTGEVE